MHRPSLSSCASAWSPSCFPLRKTGLWGFPPSRGDVNIELLLNAEPGPNLVCGGRRDQSPDFLRGMDGCHIRENQRWSGRRPLRVSFSFLNEKWSILIGVARWRSPTPLGLELSEI